MKNRVIISLLTVIAVLLGANLIVTTADSVWAQDRGLRPVDRETQQDEKRPVREQPTRGERPVRGDQPVRGARPQQREFPERPLPQRDPRVVGITSVGNLVVIAWDNGAIETREIPSPR